MEATDKERIPSPTGSSGLQNGEQKCEGTQCAGLPGTSTEHVDVCHTPSGNMIPKTDPEIPASHTGKASTTKSNKFARKGKKSSAMQGSSRYPLRSSLRSQTNKDQKSLPPVPPTLENIVREKKKKKRRKLKKDHIDDYLSIRNRVRYLLGKMNYEQSLIDAYAGEGWNGQSSEKVRPEKEIERAKSAIISFKLKIREQFQQLDSLISEGRHDEALFDTEGQIDSEDIFCAKCGSKDLSANNDIILCDGICDRGFHQKCLNPPLQNVDIPSGDEGWLCPGCDCKVDCIDLLNEVQGTDLEIEDTWEEVFPEAASAAARNNMYDDYLGLPSEDSEDEDFAPDDAENSEQEAEESSSEDSGYMSEEPGIPTHVMCNKNPVLSSDDSEDDDFDPNKPESDVESCDGAGTNDSDFTCDSEDLGTLKDLTFDAEKPLPLLKSDGSQFTLQSGNGSSAKHPRKSSLKAELLSLVEDAGLDGTMLASGKRERERLDYKKLHDETYGDDCSNSSDDENWTTNTTKKMKNGTNVKVSSSGKRCNTLAKRNSKCNNDTFIGKKSSQKLQHTSEENQYPRCDNKQILAEELGLSSQQTVASQSGNHSRKLMPTSISSKDSGSSKRKSTRKASRKKAAAGEEQSAAPNKCKNMKSTAASEKAKDDGLNPELGAIQAGIVSNEGSEMVGKQANSSDRQKLAQKEMRRTKRR